MAKIVYLPLDERPCNYRYPLDLAAMTDFHLAAPDRFVLGDKKKPADTRALAEWLLRECKDAGYAIVSVDMLLYGGIVPSRLHSLPPEECLKRLDTLRRLKKENPALRIYAFHLITRAPAYSSSEEEPDYYAECGRELYEYGWLCDKAEREGLSPDEMRRLPEVRSKIPEAVLDDFLARRRTNAAMNERSVELVQEGVIDFLIIPLDDNSKYGYTSSDQRRLAAKVEALNLFDRIMIYPGADEIGCTLLARVFSEIKSFRPLFHVRYSSTRGPFSIPKYEDRSLGESVKCHITAAGASIGDGFEEPDVHLLIHSPPVGETGMAETTDGYGGRHRAYFNEVNMWEFAQAIRRCREKGRLAALADVALCNGGDHTLMKMLAKTGLLPALSCYAAWNTSGNALGTVVAHAVIAAYHRAEPRNGEAARKASHAFLCSRLIEDWGYQALVRQEVAVRDLPRLNAGYFNLAHVQGEVESLIQRELQRFADEYMADLARVQVRAVRLPWRRMFEIDLDLALDSEKKE